MSVIHALSTLGTNAIPLLGVLYLGWSTGTLLVMFWAETILVGSVNVARIALHRSSTRKRGHYRTHFSSTAAGRKRGAKSTGTGTGAAASGTLLSEYATVTYVFSFGHAVFLFVLLYALSTNWSGEGPNPWTVDGGSLGIALLGIGLFAVAELVVDAHDLGLRSFRWIRDRTHVLYTRVVVLHLAIIFGCFTLEELDRPAAFLAVLVAFKTLVELGATSPSPRPKLPGRPPRWLAWACKIKKLDVDAEWRGICADEGRLAELEARDELRMEG